MATWGKHRSGALVIRVEQDQSVITEQPRKTDARYAVSVNAAFGGANTALVVGAP